MSLPELTFLFVVLAGVMLTVTWWAAVRLDNYSIVDVAWAGSFAVLAGVSLALSPGWFPRRLLICGLFALWSARLAVFLGRRVFGHLDQEDGRYRQLREEYGAKVRFRFFLFFQMQAVSVVLLIAPLLVSAANESPQFSWLEWLGTGIWCAGLVGEAIADHQMGRFKSNPANRGKVCELGLWHYSRHPNYFFEAVVWLGYGIFAVGSPFGWGTVYAPVIMWILLTRVTGVPYSEAQSLRTRGDAYRDYQRRTSRFVPLPPRN